ncbi:uncharacterized protein LOC131614628 [Vicia villosa]|uniref:uncharacterized protein LOC131614628 n=1 Tax=Vicia villosa TaxID=3911 RepID=UPI00273B6F1E|nr:uncharacterized protein LOC131614628 [Vicia villosa]
MRKFVWHIDLLIGKMVGVSRPTHWWERHFGPYALVWLVKDNSNWGPKPFKFNNEWFTLDSFIPFVEAEWVGMEVEGRGDYILKEKLKRLKERLRWWNTLVFGKINLEVEECVRVINEGDILLEDMAEDLLHECVDRRKDADKSVVKERRRYNHLGPINTTDGIVEKVEDVKEEVRKHFSKKFEEMDTDRLNLDGVDYKCINSDDRLFLENPFLKKKLRRLFGIVGKDFVRYFNHFLSGGTISKAVNSFFLSLILKCPNPVDLNDYRPICLVGCMYKVISKLLAGRLKKVLSSIVSLCQSAFVSGRQLLDGVLVANEVVDFAKKEGRGCLLFKVDFEKVYDKVSWNFLRYMLVRMGFGVIWRRWMEMLIFQSSMSVLVNGSPTKKFEVEKGLRQGDSLSPFLFVLVTEGLAGLVKKSVEIGEFQGFGINGNCVVVILQFANDTLIVGERNWRHVWAIKTAFRAFELVSGLEINYHKSKLIGINANNNFLEAASCVLSCRLEECPFSFLGIFVGCNPRKFES